MTDTKRYQVPQGQLALSGPVAPPVKGGLPVRGDLAHIALAGKHFVAHYAVPEARRVGSAPAALHCNEDETSDTVVELQPGDAFEALDATSEWVWGCCGPQGPTGYIRRDALA